MSAIDVIGRELNKVDALLYDMQPLPPLEDFAVGAAASSLVVSFATGAVAFHIALVPLSRRVASQLGSMRTPRRAIDRAAT